MMLLVFINTLRCPKLKNALQRRRVVVGLSQLPVEQVVLWINRKQEKVGQVFLDRGVLYDNIASSFLSQVELTYD